MRRGPRARRRLGRPHPHPRPHPRPRPRPRPHAGALFDAFAAAIFHTHEALLSTGVAEQSRPGWQEDGETGRYLEHLGTARQPLKELAVTPRLVLDAVALTLTLTLTLTLILTLTLTLTLTQARAGRCGGDATRSRACGEGLRARQVHLR